jgi:hypothetical protein
MKTLDLGEQPLTIDELLRTAAEEAILIRNKDGGEFVLEAATAFDHEVATLSGNQAFMSFLAERSKEQASLSLDEIERCLSRHEE